MRLRSVEWHEQHNHRYSERPLTGRESCVRSHSIEDNNCWYRDKHRPQEAMAATAEMVEKTFGVQY